MNDEQLKELADKDPDLAAWMKFCKDHPTAAAKAGLIIEEHGFKRGARRPIFSVAIDALWMTFVVAACISAFAPMVGQFVAMVFGLGAVVLVHKTMESTSQWLMDFLNRKRFEAVERMSKKNGDSSPDDSKTD